MNAVAAWFERTFVDLFRQLQLQFLPPLMVYVAAGLAGLTGIVGTFFVKEYLDLSAAFLAALGFWAGLPWALKMPLGHLTDLLWRQKSLLVYLGAALVALSLSIMYGLIAHTEWMRSIMSAESWFVLSALLSPTGYVLQDTVADAMSVEAVPRFDEDGRALDDAETKSLHTTMQTLGRFAVIGGLLLVAALNIFMFAGVEALDAKAKAGVYANIYLVALCIPLISVTGVILAQILQAREARRLRAAGVSEIEIDKRVYAPGEEAQPNKWIFLGSGLFVVMTMAIGLSNLPFSQELVFAGSMAIIGALMVNLVKRLPREKALQLIGTALIVFVFRAIPLPGASSTWFQIDRLGFDQQFLSILSLIASCLTLAGMIVLRPMMATRSMAWIVVVLSIAAAILYLPTIGLYYGVHEWTSKMTNGIVGARFIAVVDTMLESPLGQIAMIPLLAWIARNAPPDLKATFFAVMASFVNLALSASALFTKYMNQIFIVTREVKNPQTGVVTTPADYSQLGMLLITVALIGLVAPLLTVLLVQKSPLRTKD